MMFFFCLWNSGPITFLGKEGEIGMQALTDVREAEPCSKGGRSLDIGSEITTFTEPETIIIVNKERRLDGPISLALALRHYGPEFGWMFRPLIRPTTDEYLPEGREVEYAQADAVLEELIQEGKVEERVLILLGIDAGCRTLEWVERITVTAKKVIWFDDRPRLCNQSRRLAEIGVEVGHTHINICTPMVMEELLFRGRDETASLLATLAQVNTKPDCFIQEVLGYSKRELVDLSQQLWNLIRMGKKGSKCCDLYLSSFALWLSQDRDLWVDGLELCGDFLQKEEKKPEKTPPQRRTQPSLGF